jgi:phosphoribosylformimino-5-aminoimidazole carboxamide ribotide isomerase
MIILPAIDLKDGKVVRLYQGDFGTVHQVADDPLTTARAFYDAGARYIHMVDLDGAKDGIRQNSAIVAAVAKTGLRVELGGGIRSMSDLRAVFGMGVLRAVIGSSAVTNPEFVRQAVTEYGPERIAVGVDTRDGKVKTAGWVEDSGLDYLEFASRMAAIGVKKIIFTDIATDGTLKGPAYDRLAALQTHVKCDVIASGGVSCNEDIVRLRDMGMYGTIVGKAYYAGTVDLARAVKEAGDQC